ncbi:MAG: CotH kinase family protein [Bacteroidetes bacterium]|nr:CotH kinase family protein [Bacteroidota bacterium]MBK7431141.1 CotH kinase family protein [Bacteroidota bacterium]
MFKKYILFTGLISLLAIASSFAQAVDASKKPSKKDYGKSFFEKDSIHVIRINFTQCNFWDSLTTNKKLLDSLEISNYLQANVIIDNKKFFSTGVRFKGESSYDFYPGKKKPFRIKFNKFIKGQDFKGLEELNLTNNFKDPSMMREKLYLDLLNKEGLPAPRATYAKVYINDKYWGLYLVNESIDKVFLETRFKTSSGNLFQGEPQANFVYVGNEPMKYWNRYVLKNNLKKNDWTDLVKFIRLVNDTTLSQEEYLRKLEATMNLDKCLRAWAINNIIGNIDAYNMFYPHNFFIFHDSISTKWQWISLDGNYAFAAWNPVMPLNQLENLDILVPDSVPYKEPRPLLEKTLGENKFIQKRYLSIMTELLRKYFNEETMNQQIDSIALRIRVSVYADVNKMYSNTEFDTNINTTVGDPLDPGNFIPGLKSFIAARRKSIEKQIDELNKKLGD